MDPVVRALDCDMSLVLTTQIGLVAIVEHAPPLSEAKILARNQLSSITMISAVLNLGQILYITCFGSKICLRFVIHSEVDRPCWYISKQHWAKPTIHPA